MSLRWTSYVATGLKNAKRPDIYWFIYPCENDWWWTSPSTWIFGLYWPNPLQKADFQSIFARTLIGSPLRAFQW